MVLGGRDGLGPEANPQRPYAVVPVDDEPVGFLLRASQRTRKASTMCAWCEDVFATSEVPLFVAKRAGAAGREGNSLGTLVHADVSCSAHVRRLPNGMEGGLDLLALVERRVHELRARSSAFARRVRDESLERRGGLGRRTPSVATVGDASQA